MAQQLGLSTKAYSKIENGQTALALVRLQHIAQVLGMELLDILEFNEENVFRSCRKCSYYQQQLAVDVAFLTERLLYQQRIRELEERLAARSIE